MTAKQVEETENIVNDMAKKNKTVYAKEASLGVAKTIQGLRAVFDEVSHIFLLNLLTFILHVHCCRSSLGD